MRTNVFFKVMCFCATLIFVTISGCTDSSNMIDDKIPLSYVKISNLSCVNEDQTIRASGILKNLNNNYYDKLSIKFGLYNEDDVRIFYNYATVYNVQPNDEVRFVGVINDGRAASLCKNGKATIKAFVFPPGIEPWHRKCKTTTNNIIAPDPFTYSTQYGDSLINGYIENTGPNWYESVLVSAVIYTPNGVRIDEARDLVSNVEGKERVEYSLVINDYTMEKHKNHENLKISLTTSVSC